MSAKIFQQIARRGRAEGVVPGTEEARDWFRDNAAMLGKVNAKQMVADRTVTSSKLTVTDIGRMQQFFYDPKHKDTLPYYDRFPLVFVMEFYNDGFLGINAHYLPPMYRARLMDALYSIEMDDRNRPGKKLRLTYSLLKNAGKYKYFKPCVKRYLNTHIRSRFLNVPYDQWDIALMLPTERFVKASKQTVWKESQSTIRRA